MVRPPVLNRSVVSFVFVFGLLLCSLMSTPAQAQDKGPEDTTLPSMFRLGALDLHPGFEYNYTHDDNIFLTKNNKNSDNIHRFIPSVRLVLPFAAQSSAEAYFQYERREYDQAHTEDSDNVLTTGSLNLERIFRRYYSRSDWQWEKTDDPSSSEQQSATGARTPRRRGEFNTHLGFGGYEENKIHVETFGGLTDDQYKRAINDRLNKIQYRLGAIGEYMISPKTAVRVDYGFIRDDFTQRVATDQKDDSKSQYMRAGLSFSPSALIVGHATFGAEFRKFDVNQSRDANGFNSDVDLTWNARPSRTRVNVRFQAGLQAATTPGEYGYRRYRFDGTFGQGLFFISDRLSMLVNPAWEEDDFLRSTRNDKLASVRVALSYDFKNALLPLMLGVEYKWEQKNSNQNANDYTDNTFMAKAAVKF